MTPNPAPQFTSKKPAIIVISSHVVRGTVGNRAAALALEVLGFSVWVVPTVTLPWHPGHGPASRIVAPSVEFSQLLDDLCEAPWLNEVGAVLSGYLGGAEQVGPVAKLVDCVKSKNPDALYTLDPVLGDAPENGDGRLYVPEEQAIAIRKDLLPRADLVTPNPFELGWLANCDTPRTMESIKTAAESLNIGMVLATSCPAMMRDHIANMLVMQSGPTHMAEHRLMDGPPNGLGDLASALMLGNFLAGGDAVKALSKTSAALCETMMVAARAQSNELMLEACIGSLVNPRMPVDVRTLAKR